MTRGYEHLAKAVGRSWADSQAELLRRSGAQNWPAEWDPSWSGSLWIGAARLDASERAALLELATQAATERWNELTLERCAAHECDSVLDRAWRASVQFERQRAQH